MEKKEPEEVISMLKDDAELKKIVDSQVKKSAEETMVSVKLSEKIFLHEQDERRVAYPHIRSFYEVILGEPLDKMDLLFAFGHYLKGKNEENYNKPIEKDF